jgi:hypothetical protein
VERAGAFYPLLVAAVSQTRLPVIPNLVPSEEDRRRALPLAAVVGGGLGVVLAFAAAIALETGVSVLVAGSLVCAGLVVATGASLERSAGRVCERGLTLWQRRAEMSASVEDGALVMVVVAVLVIVLRIACLASTPAGDMTLTLIAALVASRWMQTLVYVFIARDVPLLLHSVVGASVILTVGLCTGVAEVLWLVLVGGAAYYWVRRRRRVSESAEPVASDDELAGVFALAVELLILL